MKLRREGRSGWMRAWAIAVSAALVLQGCVSAGAPVTQTIRVETPGCARASCELSNDHGRWLLAATPGEVTLTSSGQALQVSCRGEGTLPNSAGIAATTRELSKGAAVAGGVAGGAAVGATFGAAALSFIPVLGVIVVAAGVAGGAMAAQSADSRSRPLRYPDQISVPMRCDAPSEPAAATAAADAAAPSLGMRIRGMTAVETRASGLGDRGALLVVDVATGGLAATAGLRAGDWILRLDGRDVADPVAFEARWRSAAPGAILSLELWRDGRVQALTLPRREAPGS